MKRSHTLKSQVSQHTYSIRGPAEWRVHATKSRDGCGVFTWYQLWPQWLGRPSRANLVNVRLVAAAAAGHRQTEATRGRCRWSKLCNKTRRIEGKCERTPRDDDVDGDGGGGGDLLRLYHRAARRRRRRRRRHRLVLRGGHHLSRARTLPLCHRRCHRLRVGVSRREDIEKTTRTLPVFCPAFSYILNTFSAALIQDHHAIPLQFVFIWHLRTAMPPRLKVACLAFWPLLLLLLGIQGKTLMCFLEGLISLF